jgi:hypothetical protein
VPIPKKIGEIAKTVVAGPKPVVSANVPYNYAQDDKLDGTKGEYSPEVDAWIKSLGPHVESWIRQLPPSTITSLTKLGADTIRDFDNGKIPAGCVPLILRSARKEGICKRDEYIPPGQYPFVVKTAAWQTAYLVVSGDIYVGPVGAIKTPKKLTVSLSELGPSGINGPMSFMRSCLLEHGVFVKFSKEQIVRMFTDSELLKDIVGTKLRITKVWAGASSKTGTTFYAYRFQPSLETK